jgi:hypothetical protein
MKQDLIKMEFGGGETVNLSKKIFQDSVSPEF